MTLKAPVYKWGSSHRLIRRWRGPTGTVEGATGGEKPIFRRSKRAAGVTGRYATLELQLAHMIARKLMESGPGALKTSIDDAFITFERGGSGGMTHIRNILRSPMSPRLEVAAENAKARAPVGGGTTYG